MGDIEEMTERCLVVSGSASGGSFSLDRPAPTTCEEVLAHGWTAELTEGSPQIVVRGPADFDNYQEVFAESLAASQEALDFVAMRGGPRLVSDDGTLLQVNRLSEPVILAGSDVLQVQQGARLVNVQQPRFRFSM